MRRFSSIDDEGIEGEDALATDELVPLVYDELRELAHVFLTRERAGHTLQTTALAHEIYLRLAAQRKGSWGSRGEFFAAAARMVRRILVNHERSRRSLKRGGAATRMLLDENAVAQPSRSLDLLALDELLVRLAEFAPRQAQIVELRFFGGLGVEEVAEYLGVSMRTVGGEWALARAWLRLALDERARG